MHAAELSSRASVKRSLMGGGIGSIKDTRQVWSGPTVADRPKAVIRHAIHHREAVIREWSRVRLVSLVPIR
jgi:hypothetical protein